MYLKKIELVGFKSFVEATVLEFGPGISVIIGPNGCGKSNLLDAVRWVLGEQSPRILRCDRMGDIIWNGSSIRAATSMAEVSLTLAEAENVLPLGYHEITVTRRLFRSGESEYLLNKVPCRLKDIEELFMDTGIGSHAYAIMEQGKMDLLLSQKPQERRFVFEEAAGITKYETRKDEATRKLERTEQNLLRLRDIIAEVRKQVNLVERSARATQRFQEYYNELKSVELELNKTEYDRLLGEHRTLTEKNSRFQDEVGKLTAAIDKLEAQQEEAKTKATDFEKKLLATQQARQDIDREINEQSSQIAIAKNQITVADETLTNLTQDIDQTNQRITEINSAVQKTDQDLTAITAQLQKEEQIVTDQTESVSHLTTRIQQVEQQTRDTNQAIESDTKNYTELREQITRIDTTLESTIIQRKQTETNLNEKQQFAVELNQRYTGLNQQVVQIQQDVSMEKEKIKQQETTKRNLLEQQKELTTALDQLKAEWNTGKARRDSLIALKESYEGYYRGPKTILQSKTSFSGLFGTVAELIRPEVKYETALAAALDTVAQYLVVENAAEAKKAVAFLKQKKAGRATVLILDQLDAEVPVAIPAEIINSAGVIGVAATLVRYDRKYQGLVNHLLGNIIVVDTLDTALQLIPKRTAGLHCVTLDGDVISGTSQISSGETESVQLFARDREITDLANKIAQLQKQIDQTNEKINKVTQRISQTEKQVEQQQLLLFDTEVHYAELQRDIDSLSKQRSRAQEEIDAVSVVLSNQIADEKKLQEQQTEFSTQLTQVEKKIQEQQLTLTELRKQTATAVQEKEEKSNALTAKQIKLADTRNRKQNLTDTTTRLQNELQEKKTALEQKQQQKQATLDRKSTAEISIRTAEEQITLLFVKKDGIGKTLVGLQEEREKLNQQIVQFGAKVHELRRDLNGKQNELRDLEIQLAQHQLQFENILRHIWETYQTDLKTIPNPELPEPLAQLDDLGKRARIEELRARMQRLGPVSPGAVEEYEELKQRFEFLTQQEKDLTDAKEQLIATISHINRTTKDRFAETFAKIQENFHEVFRQVFRGGQAQLTLIDAENVTESGIEIMVNPPGKKLQSITLLSGGEKALSAIALLFAIYRLKPSPFCVLDEIDAPLDDVNIGRFTDLIKELTSQSQYIVITHNKRTMEAADVLYGVTMEEPGVSKVIAVKMTGQAWYGGPLTLDLDFNKAVLPKAEEVKTE
ncbi:MAG: chromosome segregation protein SMC [bacterium]|nr:chromosome segregation protein SMC [bacterium]